MALIEAVFNPFYTAGDVSTTGERGGKADAMMRTGEVRCCYFALIAIPLRVQIGV